MPNSKTVRSVKSAFIGGAIAFVVSVIVILLSLVFGPVWASALAAFPLTLIVFCVVATIGDSDEQRNFDRFLLLSAALYIVLTIGVVIWWVVSYYTLQKKSWKTRVWAGFGAGILLWVIAVITLICLYYTNPTWYKYFNPQDDPDDKVVSAVPPLPPPIPLL